MLTTNGEDHDTVLVKGENHNLIKEAEMTVHLTEDPCEDYLGRLFNKEL